MEERRAGSEPDRLAAIVLAEVDRLADVGVGLLLGLASLEDLERGERRAPPTHDRGRPEEDSSAILPAGRPPREPGMRGDRDGALGLGRARPPGPADDVGEVARVDGDDALPRRYRPPVDHRPELSRDDCEELVDHSVEKALARRRGQVGADAVVGRHERRGVKEHPDFRRRLSRLCHSLLRLNHHLETWNAPFCDVVRVAPINRKRYVDTGGVISLSSRWVKDDVSMTVGAEV